MTPPKHLDLLELRARVERADYTVDPGLVAEAIVRRVTAARARRGPGVTYTRADLAERRRQAVAGASA